MKSPIPNIIVKDSTKFNVIFSQLGIGSTDVSWAEIIKFYIAEVSRRAMTQWLILSTISTIKSAILSNKSWVLAYALCSRVYADHKISTWCGVARRDVWLMFARGFPRGFDTAWAVGSTFLPLHRLDSEYSSFRNKIPECGNIGIKRGGPMYVLREADDA